MSAFVVCLAFILSFSSFSLSALCKKNHLRSSVSFLCLFCTILPKPAYCYLCAISLIFLLDLCSLVLLLEAPFVSCYLCAISVLSLCYLCSLTLGVLFASCYRCAISVLSMVFHAGGCFLLCTISVLSLCYLCYLCAIDGLSCLEVSLALCYLCAISVLSLCYRWSFMLGNVFCSALSLCYLRAISHKSVSIYCTDWTKILSTLNDMYPSLGRQVSVVTDDLLALLS